MDRAYDQFLLPPSPCQEFRQENYLADSSMYLDDTWKHQPDYSSDSNPSMSPLHDYVPQSSPNLTSMTTFMPGSDYRIMGTSSTFNTPQLQSGESCGWQNKSPQSWEQCDVLQWIQSQCSGRAVHWDAFGDVDGAKMLGMSLEDFQHRDPNNGCQLYMAFDEIKQRDLQYQQVYFQQQTEAPINQQGEGRIPSLSLDSFIAMVSFDKHDQFTSLPGIDTFTTTPDAQPATSAAPVPLVLPKPEPNDTDSDRPSPPSSPATSEDSYISTRPVNRRGRTKGKLWEFVLSLLMNKQHNPEIIKWEDRANGVFRIVRSDQVAKLWGIRKSNPSMTYEKMSRAMRYYYRKNILERIDGRRLVYKFGASSRGWQLD